MGVGNTQRNRDRNRRVMLAAKSRPCMDCGVRLAHQFMHFDHRPDEVKFMNISRIVGDGMGVGRLRDEIAKCDVVCAPCHERRTEERRYAPTPEAPSLWGDTLGVT